jgi:hypothetical protein
MEEEVDHLKQQLNIKEMTVNELRVQVAELESALTIMQERT